MMRFLLLLPVLLSLSCAESRPPARTGVDPYSDFPDPDPFATARKGRATPPRAQSAAPVTAEQVAAGTHLDQDAYTHREWITSPDIHDISSKHEITLVDLKAERNAERIVFWIPLIHAWRHWKYLSSATDINARTIPMEVVDRRVDSDGGVTEIVVLHVDRSYLVEAAAGDGIDIRVSGTEGSAFVKMPAYYVRGFLAKVDSTWRAK